MKLSHLISIALLLIPLNACSRPSGKEPEEEQIRTWHNVVFKSGTAGYTNFRIPAAVKTAKGTILCFCEGRVDGLDDFGNIDIVLKRSEDNGATWTPLQVLADAGEHRFCNPVPVALPSGRVIVCFSWNLNETPDDHQIFVMSSDDDGVTWSAMENISEQIAKSPEYRHLPGPVHGIVKEKDPCKGRVIVPVWFRTGSTVFYSDDEGATWHHGGNIDYTAGGEPTVVELCDGSLLMNVRDHVQDDPYRHEAVSTDGGMSWQASRTSQLQETPTGCQGSLLKYKDDPATGQSVLLFSNPTHPTSRRHGAVKLSCDSGKTWTRMYRYTSDTGNDMYSSYSDLVLVGDDVIGVLYESGYQENVGIAFRSFRFGEIGKDYVVE